MFRTLTLLTHGSPPSHTPHLCLTSFIHPHVCLATSYTSSQSELRERLQVVTQVEREHVMSGNFDQLLAEQERLDRERDAEVRRLPDNSDV